MNDANRERLRPQTSTEAAGRKRQSWQWMAQGTANATVHETRSGDTSPSRPPANSIQRDRLTTTTRSGVAHWLFPHLSRKDAGVRVATDIQRFAELRGAMLRTGYQPNRVGYSLEQIEILKHFYNIKKY